MWSFKNERPNMVLGGFTSKQKLAMTAEHFYLLLPCKKGGLLKNHRLFDVKLRINDQIYNLPSLSYLC